MQLHDGGLIDGCVERRSNNLRTFCLGYSLHITEFFENKEIKPHKTYIGFAYLLFLEDVTASLAWISIDLLLELLLKVAHIGSFP